MVPLEFFDSLNLFTPALTQVLVWYNFVGDFNQTSPI